MLGWIQPGKRHCQIQASSAHSGFSAGLWKHSSCGCEALQDRAGAGAFSLVEKADCSMLCCGFAQCPPWPPWLGSGAGEQLHDQLMVPANSPWHGEPCPASLSGVSWAHWKWWWLIPLETSLLLAEPEIPGKSQEGLLKLHFKLLTVYSLSFLLSWMFTLPGTL